jgi:hypothetical protein
MWVVIGGILTLIATVLLKVVDVLVEGRGSWARRSIRADIELLEALPAEVREGTGGQSLRRRIDNALVLFGAFAAAQDTAEEATPPAADPRVAEASRRAQFAREVDLLEVRFAMWIGGVVVVLMAVAVILSPNADPSEDSTPWAAAAGGSIALGIALAVVLLTTARLLAVRVVRRRWRKAGRTVPSRR